MSNVIFCRERYKGLWAPDEFWLTLDNDPQDLAKVCNGVGSETSWTYHFIPDTIWGLNVTPASDIHDWMYSFPMDFDTEADGLLWKDKADRVLRNNLVRLFEAAEAQSGIVGWWARRCGGARRIRAQTYYEVVSNFGGPSFWEGKNKPSNVGVVK